MLGQIALWLFVVFGGIAVGAGLYEMRINLPRWFKRVGDSAIEVDADAMRTDDSGRKFWAYVTTGPLTLLTLISCIVTWNPESSLERWWFAAAWITLAERVGTLGYFIPRAVKLLQPGGLPAPEVAARAREWVRLNYVRAALALTGWLAALKALSNTAVQ